jgi:hypothetical protein
MGSMRSPERRATTGRLILDLGPLIEPVVVIREVRLGQRATDTLCCDSPGF